LKHGEKGCFFPGPFFQAGETLAPALEVPAKAGPAHFGRVGGQFFQRNTSFHVGSVTLLCRVELQRQW
jgi:hypothetical protein